MGALDLARRRGIVESVLRRLIALREAHRGYKLVVIDRASPTGVSKIPLDRVEAVTSDAAILDDGSVIPLHRVLGVEDERGRVQWLRRGKSGLGSANESS